jgi:biopolymer transport protein ExbB
MALPAAAQEAGDASGTTGGPAAPAEGTTIEDVSEDPPPTGFWDDLKIKWQLGGKTMYGLAILAIIAVISLIERFISIIVGIVSPGSVEAKCEKLWAEARYEDVASAARRGGGPLGRIIWFLVQHRDAPFEHLNVGAEDILARFHQSHAWRNYPLLVVGTVAPLLGLMGTIFGLMGAFASIGVYGSMDDPSVLAGDIGEAMVTTATGLIIAVPALIMFHLFRAFSGMLVAAVGARANHLMHTWFLGKDN